MKSAVPGGRILPLPALSICVFAVYALVSLFRPMHRLLMTVSDDASYYLEIARQVVAGCGFTFDGLHATNGFHPLWEALLVLFQAVTRFGPDAQMRWVLALQIALLSVAALWIWRGLDLLLGKRGALVGLTGFLVLVFLPSVSGMESALVWFLLAGFLNRAPLKATEAAPSWRSGAEVGAWLGMIALARLDLVFLAPLGLLVLRRRAFWAGCAAFLLLLGPYLIWNLAEFGHIVPISGTLKTSFPHPGWRPDALEISRLDRTVLAASLVLCVAYLLRRLTARKGSRSWSPLSGVSELDVIVTGAILHACYFLFFIRWGAFGWYLIPERLALISISALIVGRVQWPWLERWMAFLPLAAIVAQLWALAFVVRRDWQQPLDRSWHVASYEAAIWARENLPKDAILAMKDSGHFSLFSERRVINLDGLANGFDYQEALRRGRFASYLRENNVSYFVQHAFHNSPSVLSGEYESWEFRAFSHLYQVDGGSMLFGPSDEVYRSQPYFDGPHRTPLIIFRLPNSVPTPASS